MYLEKVNLVIYFYSKIKENIPISVYSLKIRGDKKLLNIVLVKTELKRLAIEYAP